MALLASAGVLSVILGLAAQSTLGNLVAGISLLIYRPFGIGDVLTLNTAYGKETGAVSEFSLGYTKLISEDGKTILAPNSIVISSVIEKLK
jgi:small-conductance mechanosensitive channel